MFPNCRWVLDSIRGGGLKLKIDCRQWIHSRILGGLDVRNVSARPKSETYHGSASTTDAILVVGIFGADYVNFLTGRNRRGKNYFSKKIACRHFLKLLNELSINQNNFEDNTNILNTHTHRGKLLFLFMFCFLYCRPSFINTIGWWQFFVLRLYRSGGIFGRGFKAYLNLVSITFFKISILISPSFLSFLILIETLFLFEYKLKNFFL